MFLRLNLCVQNSKLKTYLINFVKFRRNRDPFIFVLLTLKFIDLFDVNNWLWTPFIERGEANRIYIEIKFSLRNCDLFPGTALQCKETFSLLFYEFDAATHQPPPWEPEAYKLIDRIAADEGRFTNNNEVIINTETRSVEVNKKKEFILHSEIKVLV